MKKKKVVRKKSADFDDDFFGDEPEESPFSQAVDSDDAHTVIIEIPGMTASIMPCPMCGSFINSKLDTCQRCGYVLRRDHKRTDHFVA